MPYRKTRAFALMLGAGVSWISLASAANAQNEQAAEAQVDEVIVTATRRDANIQDVPMSVTAVTGEQMEKFQLQSFENIEELTAGLNLERVGRSTEVTVRGVTFDPDTSAAPSVDTYINEVPIDPNYALTKIFDVQQVEILRGPQGTLRGRPAPTGAITLTTRRPNMSEYGGTVSASYSDFESANLEAAVSVPLIRDVLAVRFAALYDEGTENDVYNILNQDTSSRETRAYRGTVQWQALENLIFTAAHSTLKDESSLYNAVYGPGVGYNGPAITPEQRLSVAEAPYLRSIDVDLTTFNAAYDFGEHRATYTFGRVAAENGEFAAGDNGNILPNFPEQGQLTNTSDRSYSHELRFESTGERAIDYSFGLFAYKRESHTTVSGIGSLLRGVYDPAISAANNPFTGAEVPILDYVLPFDIIIPTENKNRAVYGNLVFHLPARTHLTVGARYFEDTRNNSQTFIFNPAVNAVDQTTPCGFLVNFGFTGASDYPGTCAFTVDLDDDFKQSLSSERDFVYNTSLRHEFSDTLMGYVSYGTSYRPGGVTVGLIGDVPADVLFFGSEKSETAEIGIKSDWYDGRLRANISVYHQKYDNYIGRAEGIPYVDANDILQTGGGFTFNSDAVSDGLEIELAAQPTDKLSFRLNYATSDARYESGALVPCRDSNNDGVPDTNALPVDDPLTPANEQYRPLNGQTFAACPGGRLSNEPNWTLNLQSEYRTSLDFIGQPDLQGYLRGLFNYRSAFDDQGQNFVRPGAYTVSLYAGVQSPQGWEFAAYVRNALGDEELTSNPNAPIGTATVGNETFSSGYRGANYTRGREIGANFRYRFGRG